MLELTKKALIKLANSLDAEDVCKHPREEAERICNEIMKTRYKCIAFSHGMYGVTGKLIMCENKFYLITDKNNILYML